MAVETIWRTNIYWTLARVFARARDVFFCGREVSSVRIREVARGNGRRPVTRGFPSELVVLTTAQHFEIRERERRRRRRR